MYVTIVTVTMLTIATKVTMVTMLWGPLFALADWADNDRLSMCSSYYRSTRAGCDLGGTVVHLRGFSERESQLSMNVVI